MYAIRDVDREFRPPSLDHRNDLADNLNQSTVSSDGSTQGGDTMPFGIINTKSLFSQPKFAPILLNSSIRPACWLRVLLNLVKLVGL